MSMSIDGLISGMDTTALISQLLQAEAAPKTALQTRLAASQNAASAYRTVNTAFAAVRAAAENMLKPESWTATKASSSITSVAITATSTAPSGSLTFTVEKTARAHSVLNRNGTNWTSADSPYGASSITVNDGAGAAKTPAISITDTNSDGTLSLSEAASAINADTNHGLTAAVVQLSSTEFALQVTSKTTGLASNFSLTGAGTYTVPTAGQDAELKVGESPTDAYTVTSSTNTFSGLMPGATITVSREEKTTPVTLTISADPDAVAAKVQAMVDAVNSAVDTVDRYTDNSKGSKEALRGDFSINQLAGQLLDSIALAVDDRSLKSFGLELSSDGAKIKFSKATFLDALEADPGLAKSIVGGVAAGPGADLVNGTTDDVVANGVAGRLLDISKAASDSATGSLVKLAAGQDSMGADLKLRIEAWDLRLAKRKEMLTRQFGAMETALSSLRNQSTWLAGQINSLPSYG